MKALRFLVLTISLIGPFYLTAQTCPANAAVIDNQDITVTGTNCSVTAGTVTQGFWAEVVLIIAEGATLTITGNLHIYDRVEVYGTLIVHGNVTAQPIAGVSTVYVGETGNFNVNGNYTNGEEDIVIIPGLIEFDGAPGTTDVDGNMNVTGTFTNNDGGTTTVSETGTLQSGTFDDNGGTVTIEGVPDPEDCEDGCCGGGCLALPVVLLDFNATELNGSAQLTWTTAQELDNDYFEIYKLKNGNNSFELIGTLEGQGTTKEVTTYQFLDSDFSTDAYYRIKQIDFDGQSETFGPVALSKSEIDHLTLNIYPNPSSGPISISGGGFTGFAIHNMQGQLIRAEENRMVDEATSIINTTLGQSKGTFFVSFYNEKEKVVRRLVKR